MRTSSRSILVAAAIVASSCTHAAPRPASAKAGVVPAAPAPARPNLPVASTGAPAPKAGSGASGASAPAPPRVKVGDPFTFPTELAQVWPTGAKVRLDQRNGKPLALFFWGTGVGISRDDLVTFDAFVKKEKLRNRMDVYAVAGFSADKGSPADAKDMAQILGLQEVPVLADPDFALSTALNAQQFPEIDVISGDGKVLAKEIRGVDHANLQVPSGTGGAVVPMTAADYLLRVAVTKNGPELARTWPFYPSDRLLGKHYADFELPRFSVDGWGKGKVERLSRLLSGKRPAVVLFFSATCEHCQVDVPQIVKFMQVHPDDYDVVGVTRIRNDQHRKVSEQYFKAQGITFPVLEDQGGVTDAWKVTSTPTDFYIAANGTIASMSYYQHEDLAKDWMAKKAQIASVAAVPVEAKAKGWTFPLKVKDEAGKEVDLASMAGKPTIVHFWATWCIPCRKELPDLLARLPELKKAGNVVLVTVEDDPAVLKKYRSDTGLDIKSYLAPHGGLAGKLDFGRSVPRTYLLDPTGKVIAVYAGSYEWADAEKFARVVGRMTP